MKESIYIETTIPSYYVAKPSRDVVQAGRQALTIDWWDNQRTGYDLFTSQAVLDESAQGDQGYAAKRIELLKEIPLLQVSQTVISLAKKLIDQDIIPDKASEDAIHVACASVHEMSYLLTWNCRHIANPHTQKRMRSTIETNGFDMPVICTPEEFYSDE